MLRTRTLAQNPKIILADEPVAALDPVTAKQGTADAKPVDSKDPVCADFETKTGEQKVTLHFAADNPPYAGDYSDTVMFNLAVFPQN